MGIRIVLGCACVAVSMLSLPSSALARGQDRYSRTGFHAGASVLVAIPTYQDELRRKLAPLDPLLAQTASLGPNAGFDLRGGYRLNERVAAEMGFEWNAPYSVEAGGLEVGEISSWMFYIDAKVFVLTGRIQPFVLLGMGAYHQSLLVPTPLGKRSGTSFAPRFGGGLEYYFTRHIALTSEVNYVIGTGDIDERNRVGVYLGMFYRF